MEKITLHIIAKDEVKEVKNIIDKYKDYFDFITIAGDSLHEDFGKLTGQYNGKNRDCIVQYYQYKWIKDFADKRNFLASKCPTEYYFRLDTDDEILNPEAIQDVLEKMKAQKIDVLYVPYHYSEDADGNLNGFHWRETIISKSSNHYWKKAVHENIFIENTEAFRGVREKSIIIKHNITREHIDESNIRNLEILLAEFNRDKEKTDIRTVAYIGRSFMGMGMYDRAYMFLKLLVDKSGWDDDVYFGHVQCAECLHRLGKDQEAIDHAFTAMRDKPDWPDAYLKLGTIYLDRNEFKQAVEWLQMGLIKPAPKTMAVLDHTQYSYQALFNLAMSYLGLGNIERAFTCYQEALKIAPSNETLKKAGELFNEAKEADELFSGFKKIEKYLKKHDPKQLKKLTDVLTDKMLQDERYYALKAMYAEPKKWEKNSVVIFCGKAYEDWADPSVLTGIGGSEEAVIYISRELVKLGYSVTVYNQCGELSGSYNGVEYRNWFEFNARDEFDTIIFWRGIPGEVRANKRIVWLHDVPVGMFTTENVKWFDKVLVLSEFHKSLLPSCVPQEKVFVTRNGINLKDCNQITTRNINKIIYASSYDRGLEHILDMWEDVRKEVPEAELHVFYGWNTYDKMVKMRMRDGKFKQQMVEKLNKPGVVDHGRVGQKQLAKELLSSGIYAYPSHFEEISCISVMRAQACGCVPVTTDYAALAETNKHGIRVVGKAGDGDTNDRFKVALVAALKTDLSKERLDMMDKRDEWSWEGVAKEWHSQLLAL